MRISPQSATLVAILSIAWSGSRLSADVEFEKDVRPIFEQHCVSCHSSSISKGDFSLETAAEVAESGYIVPGDVSSSHLVDLIKPHDGQPARMPDEGEPLSDAEVATIAGWIEAGAVWPEGVRVVEKSKADGTWWSLQLLKEFDQPRTVDSFIETKLREAGLSMNGPADRRTLIRRATYDLIGLPPTPEEVAAFESDKSPDAYEILIDRLLASPHYGERWGRHWLDVVRFGESNGYERNVIINNIWPFRDYVIRSINEDKPFDQFIREHLAGDVIAGGDPDTAVASAFLVAGPYDDVGNQDPVQAAQIRANTMDEIISATSEAFLGLTVGCARCHNHKFDPITQADYYAMYATFSGVRHGAVPLATSEATNERNELLAPLNAKKAELEKAQRAIRKSVLDRAKSKLAEYESTWTREPVDRTGTEEKFDPVVAKFIRLTCDGRDDNPEALTGWHIDEFEVWATPSEALTATNVALSSNGSKASGAARNIEDFPGAYGPHLAIDGKTGARFIAAGRDLTIELAEPTTIDRVVFSSAKGETVPEHRKFVFVAEYRIDVSSDGQSWTTVAGGANRKPVSDRHRDHRLFEAEITEEERAQIAQLNSDIGAVNAEIAKVPGLPSVFIGIRNPNDAKGPFSVFIGGSPQRKGDAVVPASLASLEPTASAYELGVDAPEAERRKSLADWIASDDNALTARVLVNRVWHYHFGTGIVNTPSDFGYMGGHPSHPELLDWLAQQLIDGDWKLKSLHKTIMLSKTYQQASTFDANAAKVDGDSRLLWRYPPRRLSAEEIRDTILSITGKLDTRRGGPGFRLYQFMQDNVCTYVPLEKHGPETYRRAVYHQNARASVVDLMTDFDQPDCAFSTPRRAETTTPLQALTMMNHSFTLDMAEALAGRVKAETGDDIDAQIQRLYELCYEREPTADERTTCRDFLSQNDLPTLCRVLLNSSELIYVW